MKRDWSFPIGRIFGIQLRVHLTFFLIVALFALGSTVEGGLGLLNGMLWLVIIFTCILAHEMSHSLVARRRGATVKAIVLLPIGGVSQLENLPETAPDEFAIAIVGPLASFAIALGAAGIAIALRVPLLPVNLYGGTLVTRIAWFNLIIGAFNLLPAFPMDGGRVLRSILERRLDLEAATHRAAQIGRIFAILMIAAGVFFNIWFVLIGIFVFFGASSEEAATVVHVRIREVLVSDVMTINPVTVDAQTAVGYLIEMIRRTSQRDFPVVEAGQYAGMVSADRLISVAPETPIGSVSDRSVPGVAPSDHVEKVETETLAPYGRKAVAVVDDGRVVGLLTQDDVGRLVQEAIARSSDQPTQGAP